MKSKSDVSYRHKLFYLKKSETNRIKCNKTYEKEKFMMKHNLFKNTASIDSNNVFDTIEHWAIVRELCKTRTESIYTMMITNIYEHTY